MYGTVARVRVKPGQGARLMELMKEYDELDVRGMRTELMFQSDNDPNEYFLAVAFDSKEAYRANAESPEQHERYMKLREILEADPDWHDGTVVHVQSA